MTATGLTVDRWVIEPDPDDPDNPERAIITFFSDGFSSVSIRFDGRQRHYPSKKGPAWDVNISIMQDFLEELAAYMGQTVDDRLL